MMTFVCLLRGVNVGGHHQLKMDKLRALCEGLGYSNVKSYLQSGNIVFRYKNMVAETISKYLEKVIEESVGFHSDVIVRTREEMADVVKNNPFIGRKEIEPGKLAVTFMTAKLSAEAKKALRSVTGFVEEIRPRDREIYIYFPDGMGRSKVVPALNRVLEGMGTARNWNTVTKLLQMAEEAEQHLNLNVR